MISEEDRQLLEKVLESAENYYKNKKNTTK